jgi:hypothetical protein
MARDAALQDKSVVCGGRPEEAGDVVGCRDRTRIGLCPYDCLCHNNFLTG